MAWPDQPTAINALRNLLGDGPTDKYCYQKKVFGTINGINASFKTFEFRRVTSFTSATSPVGVYLDSALLPTSDIVSDDTVSGEFSLSPVVASGLTNRNVLTATYYYQWFEDAELITFLQNASTWLILGTAFQNIPDGLNSSLLRFAAQEAYEKAAMKYSVRASQTFKLEDAPSEDILKSVAAFKDMAEGYMEKAIQLRDDYYTRGGQALQPLYSFGLGSVVDPVPRR